jgi:hypothetical protein
VANINRFTGPLWDLDTFYLFDDFANEILANNWVTTVVGTTPTAAVGDAAGGVLALTTTATDNDEVNIESANELFIFAAGRPIYGRCRLQYSEAATDDANVGFGFMDAVGAEALADNGGGIAASKDFLAIYKIDGETVWTAASGNGANRTVTKSTKTAGGTAYQELEITAADWDGVSMMVTFKVDGEYLKDANGNVIRQTVLIASATEMSVWAAAKAGGSNIETVLVDYIYAAQKR